MRQRVSLAGTFATIGGSEVMASLAQPGAMASRTQIYRRGIKEGHIYPRSRDLQDTHPPDIERNGIIGRMVA